MRGFLRRPVAIKAELDTLLAKNIAIVEYLSDNKMRLTAHLESLPAVKTPPLRAMESRRRGRVVPGSLRAGCFSAGKI